MQAHFIAHGAPVPPRTLAVDGVIPGAERTLSHWLGAPAIPVPLVSDTSTGILANAARDPEQWLAGMEWAGNDHVDADGLLAVALACRPDLASDRDLLIGAAEAGDFTAYPGPNAYRLMLRLHQYIRSCAQRGPGWESVAYQDIAAALPGLIRDSALADAERDAQVALVDQVRTRLLNQDGFLIHRAPQLLCLAWRRRRGQGTDPFLAVHQDEDLPLMAIDAVATPHDFQLTAMAVPEGTIYQLDAPRHSWARTVDRPLVPWPDLSRLRDALQAQEAGGCQWLARPQASRIGFVCQLASADAAGTPRASGIALEALIAACSQALAKRP